MKKSTTPRQKRKAAKQERRDYNAGKKVQIFVDDPHIELRSEKRLDAAEWGQILSRTDFMLARFYPHVHAVVIRPTPHAPTIDPREMI